MLILPLHKPLNFQTLPWLSLLLIAVNTAIYCLFQLPAERYQMQAMQHYASAQLIDIEWPAYVAMTKPEAEQEQVQQIEQLGKSGDFPSMFLTQMRMTTLQNSEAFTALRTSGSMLDANDPRKNSYIESRRYVDSLWSRGNFTERYAMKFGTFEPHRFLTACFLHGDFSHLFGNMLMLFVVALVLERAFSGGRFLILYLLAGIGASIVSSYAHRHHFGYGLGASGAIAGLMGALPVVWGLRKIRVFYWIAFYFNYARVPALILLPLWLGYELLQMQISNSNVDFQAHAGGMITGAALAWLLTRWAAPDEDFFEDLTPSAAAAAGAKPPSSLARERELHLQLERQWQAGLDALGRADFAEASRLLARVAAQRRNDFALQVQAYQAAKFAGDATLMLENAKRALQQPVSQPEQAQRQGALWRELEQKGLQTQLPAALLNTLATRWQQAHWEWAWEALVRLSQAPDRGTLTPTQWQQLFSSMLAHCREPTQAAQLEKMLARIAQPASTAG